MATQYVAVTTLSVPRYNDEGKVTNKNYLVRAGRPIPEEILDEKHHAEMIRRGLESGALREREVPQDSEPEEIEGSEVNGPGVQMLSTVPVRPEETDAKAAAAAAERAENPDAAVDEDGRLPKPKPNAKRDLWVAYAEQENVAANGTRDEIMTRVEEAERSKVGGEQK